MAYMDDLRRLSKLKRTKPNYEKIGEALEEMEAFAEQATEYVYAVKTAREAVNEFGNVLDNADEGNPLMDVSEELKAAVVTFVELLPGNEDTSLTELVEAVRERYDEYASIMDDRDYTAEDREGVWGELLDSIDEVATALEPVREEGK